MGAALTFSFTLDMARAEQYVVALDAAVQGACQGSAEEGAALAQELAPVDTSSLRGTIDFTEGELNDPGAHVHEWSVNAGNTETGYLGGGSYGSRPAGAPVDYADTQEYGPGNHTSYMTPASEQLAEAHEQRVAAAIAGIAF